jgi:tryptophan synthase alpha chain
MAPKAKASRITRAFKRLGREGRVAFIPYIMAGDPSLERTADLIGLLERSGADVIELGVPFSDPMADGPVIQRAAERAVERGVHLADVIGLVRRVREGSQVPIVLMTYYNPILRYGEERFVREAVAAGVDGVIVPDLPAHEAGGLIPHARALGLDTIFLFAPTSTPKRRKLVAKASRGFIYYVSIAGITGSRLTLDAGARQSIDEARRTGRCPVALGFGVSTPEEAAEAAGLADGVIVGSAIVRRVGGPEGDAALETYVKSLREALDRGRGAISGGAAV